MTPYSQIYEQFAQKISDIKLLSLSDEDIASMMYCWMRSACVKFLNSENDLTDRDDTLQQFNYDLPELDQEIIANFMVVEWLEPQLNSTLLTSQFYGSKEEKFYAQANQLEKLMSLSEKNQIKTKKLIRDYGYQKVLKGVAT